MVYVNNIQINFKLQINCKTSYHSYTEIFDKKIKSTNRMMLIF